METGGDRCKAITEDVFPVRRATLQVGGLTAWWREGRVQSAEQHPNTTNQGGGHLPTPGF